MVLLQGAYGFGSRMEKSQKKKINIQKHEKINSILCLLPPLYNPRLERFPQMGTEIRVIPCQLLLSGRFTEA